MTDESDVGAIIDGLTQKMRAAILHAPPWGDTRRIARGTKHQTKLGLRKRRLADDCRRLTHLGLEVRQVLAVNRRIAAAGNGEP